MPLNSFLPHTWVWLGRLCLRVTSSSSGNSLQPVVYYSIVFSPLCCNSSLDILVSAYIQRKEQHALVNRRAFWCFLPWQLALFLNYSNTSIFSIWQSKSTLNSSPSTDAAAHTWANHYPANNGILHWLTNSYRGCKARNTQRSNLERYLVYRLLLGFPWEHLDVQNLRLLVDHGSPFHLVLW